MDALILAAVVVGLLGLFVVLSGIIWLAERFIPGLTEWLDRHTPEGGMWE